MSLLCDKRERTRKKIVYVEGSRSARERVAAGKCVRARVYFHLYTFPADVVHPSKRKATFTRQTKTQLEKKKTERFNE